MDSELEGGEGVDELKGVGEWSELVRGESFKSFDESFESFESFESIDAFELFNESLDSFNSLNDSLKDSFI